MMGENDRKQPIIPHHYSCHFSIHFSSSFLCAVIFIRAALFPPQEIHLFALGHMSDALLYKTLTSVVSRKPPCIPTETPMGRPVRRSRRRRLSAALHRQPARSDPRPSHRQSQKKKTPSGTHFGATRPPHTPMMAQCSNAAESIVPDPIQYNTYIPIQCAKSNTHLFDLCEDFGKGGFPTKTYMTFQKAKCQGKWGDKNPPPRSRKGLRGPHVKS